MFRYDFVAVNPFKVKLVNKIELYELIFDHMISKHLPTLIGKISLNSTLFR